MALAFGGLTFKLLPDNTIEVNLDGNKTNLNIKDIKELNMWLNMQQQEILYGAKTAPTYDPNQGNNAYYGAEEQAPAHPIRDFAGEVRIR